MKNKLAVILLVSAILTVFCPLNSFALGAIAVDDNGGKGQPLFALVIGHKSNDNASQAALNKCKANGGIHCSIVLNFERCGSISSSQTSYGVGSGITGKIARNMSLRNCGEGCRVVGNECEDY